MSLVTLLRETHIKNEFKKFVKTPRNFDTSRKILVNPYHNNSPSLIGTAFDYLFRFVLQKRFSSSCSQPWIAEKSLEILKDYDSPVYSLAFKRVAEAKDRLIDFCNTGLMNNYLIESSVFLARLDGVYRNGTDLVKEVLIEADKNIIKELREFMFILPKEEFVTNKFCYLNPSFGAGSWLVGNADADLIIDDCLIDLKTSKHLRLDEHFHQLIGYYILLRLGGVYDENSDAVVDYFREKCAIEYLGIYFARYAYFFKANISELIDIKMLPNFVRWFVDEAARDDKEKIEIFKEIDLTD